MHTTIIATVALAAFALAAPAPEARPKLFSLKISSSDGRFNGMCVENFHTGAGRADAVLTPCTKDSVVYFSNGTSIQTTTLVDAPNPGGVMFAGEGTNYDYWYPVTMAAGYGTSELLYDSSYGFIQNGGVGFLVCRWAHLGMPQLFSFAFGDSQQVYTANCANVKLFKG